MQKIYLLLIAMCCFENAFSQCATTATVSSFSPQSGPAGTVITITGTNFDPVAINNTVFFGHVKAVASAVTSTTLQVTVPTGALSQYLAVNKPCGATAMLQYGFHVINPCAGNLVSGSFGTRVTYPADNRGYSAALGDLDGDGKPELAVANYIPVTGSPKISLYQNLSTPGNVNFSSKTDYDCVSQLYGVSFFDIDMDGKLDLIGQQPGTNLHIFRNISTTPGTIALAARVTIAATNGSWAAAFADIDGDGKPDVIWGGNRAATIILNQSTPGNISFSSSVTVTTQDPGFCNTTDVKVADLDGDGKNDIITAGYNCSTVGIVRNTSTPGTLSFDPYFILPSSGQVYGVAVGDLNNDGKPEIVAGNRNVSILHVFENQSTPGTLNAASFLTPVNLAAAGSTVMIEDMTGDGKPEVLSSNGGSLYGFNNNYSGTGAINSSSFGPARTWTLSCGGVPRMFDLGDVDMDGYIDAVSARDASSPGAVAEVIRRIPSPGFSGVVPATTLNVTANCDDNTWKYFYDPASTDKILLAVKDNGLNLGTISASVYAEANAGTVNGQRYLRRHYIINSSLNPVGLRRVRLYYTAADFANLQAVTPGLNTASQLSITKYSGPGEDGIYDPQAGGLLTFIPKTAITTGTAYGQSFLEFDVTGFSEFWIHTGLFILPSDRFSFQAQKCNQQICLQWKTENEQQVSHFDIERSSDAIWFTSIEKITAKNQFYNSYSSTDKVSNEATVYYRIKQVNADGSFKYSQVIPIRPDKTINITASPNPVKDLVKITAPGAVIKNVQLTNMPGQVLKTWQPSGNNMYDLSSFPNGIYTLKVFAGDVTEIVRVVVWH